jgi:hypothetical protein
MDCIDAGCRTGTHGYCYKQYQNKQVLAHRLAYAEAHGLNVFTMGGVVLHSCDNPRCVNPDHLTLGTHADNVADKISKGRHCHGETWAGVVGEAHYKEFGRAAMARRFNVAPQLISAIVLGQIWRQA